MTPRAAPMPPEQRRRAIVEVVVPLLVEKGREPSTREIADAAGIAEGTIFRAFSDKSALWCATAEATLDPQVELAELQRAVQDTAGLREMIALVADHLLARSQRVMAVMGLMRGAWQAQRAASSTPLASAGPPQFVVEANRALMAGLTDLFEPHRAELGVEPHVAASVLRALVLGNRHPGAHADHLLGPDDVAAVMLDGVRRRDGERGS